MKIFCKRKVIQKIATILLILTLFNFTIPTRTKASSALEEISDAIAEIGDSIGEFAITAVNTLVLAIGDSVINVAQHFMLGMRKNSTAVILSVPPSSLALLISAAAHSS